MEKTAYIQRKINNIVQQYSDMFKVVMITGPRQAGKTTFLKHYRPKLKIINFDNTEQRKKLLENEKEFFKNERLPVIFDEVQRVPEIFLKIKEKVDEKEEKGQVFLSGSQSFRLMNYVSDSLAGRVGIINLLGLSLSEKLDNYKEHKKINDSFDYQSFVWEEIINGGSPEVFKNKNNEKFDSELYWQNYIDTYIERDVRELSQIGNSIKFYDFICAIANQVGSTLNISTITNALKIKYETAIHFLSILEASHIIYILKPYNNNLLKRLEKTPKVYFLDTGLLCNLLKIKNIDELKENDKKGGIFEDFVVSEIIKTYYNDGINRPPIYFYRDKDKNEIDIIREEEGYLYLIEIKAHDKISKDDIENFKKLMKNKKLKVKSGMLISLNKEIISFSETEKNMPIWMLE